MAPRLSKARHDAVLNSPVGQMLDRLVREAAARGEVIPAYDGGNIIQALWNAFHPPGVQ